MHSTRIAFRAHQLLELSAAGLLSAALAACSAGEVGAPGAAEATDGLPWLVGADRVPGKLIVNGAFAEPDIALEYPDGAIVTVSFGPQGAAAFSEALPMGAESKLPLADNGGIEESLANLAPNIDFTAALGRARARDYPPPEDVEATALRPEVRSWLEGIGQLETYLDQNAEPLTSDAPISVRSQSCSAWGWFIDHYWNGASYTQSDNCETEFTEAYLGFDNCKFAAMNDHGPGNATWLRQAKSRGIGNWTSTSVLGLEPYYAYGTTFRDINGPGIVLATCKSTGTRDDAHRIHGVARSWN